MSKGDGDKRSVTTDALETLGQVISVNEKRDAIHLAVEPTVAQEKLYPGQHVSADGRNGKPCVGIVDPFLEGPVFPGQRFWLVVYPRQIHSLRHVWTHPAFPDAPELVDVTARKRASEEWLRDFCKHADCPDYDTVLAAAIGDHVAVVDAESYGDHAYKNDGEYLIFLGRDAHSEIPPQFWDHVEVVTGRIIPHAKRARSFSCSC
jgi:hypothetical protein